MPLVLLTALSTLALFFSLSYPFHLPPWPTFFNEWFFGLFTLVALSIVFINGKLKQASPWPWGIALAVIATHYLFLQNANPLLREVLWVTLSFVAVGYAAFLLGRNLDTADLIAWPLGIIWAAAVLAAFVAILQYLGTFASQQWNLGLVLFMQEGHRAASLIGQSNQLGTILVIGSWATCFAWCTRSRTVVWRLVALLSLVLFAYGIHLSGSRTAALNLVLGPALLFAGMLWRKSRQYNIVLLAIVPLTVLTAFSLNESAPPQKLAQTDSAASTLATNTPQTVAGRTIAGDSTRFEIWKMATMAIQDSPWLGHGFEGMTRSHFRLSTEFKGFNNQIIRNAHNTVLELWVTYGVPLGTAFVGVIAWAWLRAWKSAQSPDRLFIWLMCTAILVHALLEYPLHYGFFFWLLCMLFGHLIPPKDGERRTVTLRHPGLVATAWLGVCSFVLYAVWSSYVDIEARYTELRTRGAPLVRSDAENIAPLTQALYPRLLERLYWLSRPASEAEKWTEQDLERLSTIAVYDPLPSILTKLAWAYGLRGDTEQATWWTERFCRMYPRDMCSHFQEAWTANHTKRQDWPTLPWSRWPRE